MCTPPGEPPLQAGLHPVILPPSVNHPFKPPFQGHFVFLREKARAEETGFKTGLHQAPATKATA